MYSECRCSNELSADTHKLSNDNCMAPCPGDPRLSCGGRANIAVYSLIAATSQTKHSTTTTTTTSSSAPASSKTATKATASSEPFPSSIAPGKPASAPTVAAITGSLSGAVLIVACVFLFYRAHTRKRQVQDAHLKSILGRRGQHSAQTPIFTQADIHNQVDDLVAPGQDHGGYGKGGGNTRTNNNGRNEHDAYGRLVPNTPALESGEKFPSARRGSRTTTWEERSSIAILGQERSPPTNPHITSQTQVHVEDAASSAVHWRRPSNPIDSASSSQLGMNTMSTTHKRTKSTHNIASPPPSARIDGLGERAWHRRKLSTPYQPTVGVGTIARAGAPSGPPPRVLPPAPSTAPTQSGSRAQSQPRTPDTKKSSGKPLPPPPSRPQRSFDTIEFEAGLGEELAELMAPDVLQPGAWGTGGSGVSEWSPLGIHQNKSTPSLGRYGSLTRSRQANTESPVLGWRTPTGDMQGVTGDNDLPRTPVLPPVAPGERFDHRRWRGTSFAEPYEVQGSRSQHGEGDDRSPLSASSTGTSILFGLDEFNRRL